MCRSSTAAGTSRSSRNRCELIAASDTPCLRGIDMSFYHEATIIADRRQCTLTRLLRRLLRHLLLRLQGSMQRTLGMGLASRRVCTCLCLC